MKLMTKERKIIRIPTGAELIELRLALGMDQTELADMIGTTQGQWSNWEKGRRKPSRQSAMLIELILVPLARKKSGKKKS